MSIPSKYRWVIVGELVIRKSKRSDVNTPLFELDDVISAAKKILAGNKHHRRYGEDKSLLMWWDKFSEKDDYIVFLVNSGDKNTSGISFVDFEDLSPRDVTKEEGEGAYSTSHVIIQKTPVKSGNKHHYLILVEKVPGVSITSFKNHLAWMFNQFDEFLRSYKDPDGQEKEAKPVFDLLGFQSSTLKDALKNGILQDIEFVEHQEIEDLDEDTVIKSKIYETKWDVRKKVSEKQAETLFGEAKRYCKEKFGQKKNKAKMYVRIKSATGQIKRTEVKQKEEALEQIFLLNEKIEGFKTPLPPRHEGVDSVVRDKIIAKAKSLCSDD